MSKRIDFLTVTLAWYKEPVWGILRLGPGRFSINLWKASLIIEMWWIRGGLSYV